MIRVYVIDYGRKFLALRWRDPTTGKQCTRSSKCTTRGKAERAASDLEKHLNETQASGDGAMPWESFQDLYQIRHLSGLESATERWHLSKLKVFTETMRPAQLSSINTSVVAQYVSQLRGQKKSESTIRGHIIAIRCALQWSQEQGYTSTVPTFPKSREVSGRKVKGRDLTLFEFVRLLSAVGKVVQPQQIASWRHLLYGLWLSGLRLSEAVSLSWDDPTAPRINLAGEYPLLEIDAEDDKGREHRLLPITPDFGRWLLRTPIEHRTGRVFAPIGERGQPITNETNISRTISAFGETAGIVVDHRRKKYASAHDLRRTFGTRWSKRVLPVVLRDLMRHRDVSTTMKYYVGQDAQQTAAALWSVQTRVTEKVTPAAFKPPTPTN